MEFGHFIKRLFRWYKSKSDASNSKSNREFITNVNKMKDFQKFIDVET